MASKFPEMLALTAWWWSATILLLLLGKDDLPVVRRGVVPGGLSGGRGNQRKPIGGCQ
jgi:hypothetical protein